METWGTNILYYFDLGRYAGFYHPDDVLHQLFISHLSEQVVSLIACVNRQISNWIWFPLIQHELYIFVTRQNAHRVRKQKDTALPSGGRPDQFYYNPEMYGGDHCLLAINRDDIDNLLEGSEDGLSKMRHVDEDFEPLANEAYATIGMPDITLSTAWAIFRQMVDQMSADDGIASP